MGPVCLREPLGGLGPTARGGEPLAPAAAPSAAHGTTFYMTWNFLSISNIHPAELCQILRVLVCTAPPVVDL
jgi:hypothetical protein